MSVMKTLRALFLFLIFVTVASESLAQADPRLLEIIEQAVPKRDPSWHVKTSGKGKTGWAASIVEWTNGKAEVSARYSTYSVKNASYMFSFDRRSGRLLEGIGDEAIVDSTAAPMFVVRFRKGGVVVSVLSRTDGLVETLARYIADAIPTEEAYAKVFPVPPSNGDFCHVYVVDGEKATKLKEGNQDPKLAKDVDTDFPEFRTDIGEETLTTKTYPFPNSKLFITASVYYTDESMASKKGVDSMLIGLAVGPKALEDAFSADDNAFAEATFFDRDTLRIKKYLKVNGRRYLVGMQCNSNGKNDLP